MKKITIEKNEHTDGFIATIGLTDGCKQIIQGKSKMSLKFRAMKLQREDLIRFDLRVGTIDPPNLKKNHSYIFTKKS